MDNDPNLKNALTTNLTTNRPNLSHSSTHSQSKLWYSNNSTNEQLTDIFGWIVNLLNANQTPSPNSNLRETKAYIPNIFSSTKLDKLNNFLFQYCIYFYANLCNLI